MKPLKTAIIQEEACIGCAKCLDVCPFDAIIGASRFTHTVLKGECTGCDLCVPVCPVDCITMVPLEKPLYSKEKAKARVTARKARLKQTQAVFEAKHQEAKQQLTSLLASLASD